MLNDADEETARDAICKAFIRLSIAQQPVLTPVDAPIYGRFTAKERSTRIRYVRRQHQPYCDDDSIYNHGTLPVCYLSYHSKHRFLCFCNITE